MKYTASILLLLAFFLPVSSGLAQKIDWMSWEEAVYANRNKEAKKLFVDVYTDWCGWCKKMDKTTFRDPDVVELINEHYYPVKFDAEQKKTIVMGNDTLEHKSGVGKKGTHELALRLMNGKASYPTVVFLNENIQLITPVPGYRKADQMAAILAFFGEDHHKQEKDINKFIKNYPDNGKGKKKEDKSKKSDQKKKTSSKEKEEKHSDHPVNWKSWEEMTMAQQENPRYVFIDLYAHWCGPCKLLDKRTLQDPKVADFLNEHFHAVKFNAETRDTIRFQGQNYKNTKPGFKKSRKKQRGKPHELAVKLVDGRLAYPTMVVLDRKWGRVGTLRGFKKPSQLLKKLRSMIDQEEEN